MTHTIYHREGSLKQTHHIESLSTTPVLLTADAGHISELTAGNPDIDSEVYLKFWFQIDAPDLTTDEADMIIPLHRLVSDNVVPVRFEFGASEDDAEVPFLPIDAGVWVAATKDAGLGNTVPDSGGFPWTAIEVVLNAYSS